MKHKPCQIYFTAEVPFTKNGKSKAAIWKKADTITDFFNVVTLKKAKTADAAKMLFDDENLYINVKSAVPHDLYFYREDVSLWLNSYYYLQIPFADERLLKIVFNEKGTVYATVNNAEVSCSDIKIFTSETKKKTTIEFEMNLVIPWTFITENIKKLAAFDFNLSHILIPEQRADLEHYTLNSFRTNGMESAITAQLIRKEKTSAGETYSARDHFFAANKEIAITLSPAQAGKICKNILGINNSPRINNAKGMEKEKELFKKLAPARVRHHDAALTDSGYGLIDVSRIFPLFHADHNDPKNYDFGPTDLCLEQVVECGVDIEFRFGESIEHSARRFRVDPPADPEKWAAICVNIFRHYTEKWANGKKWKISYASLWEEPDNPKLFDGPYDKYLTLYKAFATQMKKAFPKVKVGGPQSITTKAVEQLAAYCKEHSLPLDFVSVTMYARSPYAFVNKMKEIREIADKYGFKKAETFLCEWNFGPKDWSNLYAERDVPLSMSSAAFDAASVIALQDVADMAYFYYWASRAGSMWPLFNNWQDPFKSFYALTFYTEFANKKLKRIPANVSSDTAGLYSLAGIDKDGKVYLLISQFRSPSETVSINLPAGYKSCKVKIVSDTYPKGEGLKKLKSNGKGKFRFPLDAKVFGVYLMEFDKA